MKNIFNGYYKRYDAWYNKNKFAYLSELEAIREVLPKKGKGGFVVICAKKTVLLHFQKLICLMALK